MQKRTLMANLCLHLFSPMILQKYAQRIIAMAEAVRDTYHHPNAIHGNNKIAKGVIFYEGAFKEGAISCLIKIFVWGVGNLDDKSSLYNFISNAQAQENKEAIDLWTSIAQPTICYWFNYILEEKINHMKVMQKTFKSFWNLMEWKFDGCCNKPIISYEYYQEECEKNSLARG
jgi:hypothetical protein